MEKVCGGSVSVAGIGSCSGKNPQPPTKNPPPKGGSGSGGGATGDKPPVITNLKVTPHSISASHASATITYHDNEPGTTTLLEVTHGSVAGHRFPSRSCGTSTRPRPSPSRFPRVFAGNAFAPGAYSVVAMPINTKGMKGANVTAGFVITP